LALVLFRYTTELPDVARCQRGPAGARRAHVRRRPPGFGFETFNVCAGSRRDRLLPFAVLKDHMVLFENGNTLAAARSEGLPDSVLEIDWNAYLATASDAIKTTRTNMMTMARTKL
ncbi:hypothetical protein HK405_015754, partial [Cladochytrium tenue]